MFLADARRSGAGGGRHGPPVSTVDERRDAGTAFFFAGCPAERGSRGSPPGQSLGLESSSGVREKEGTNSRMNSWTSGRGF